ncbi:signal peptidase II [Marinobacterium jannaschii]|uniref:signal peptidase II n=1 Tax=Marinobacterium jannaschii TaxID=64970 RepID=UPI000484B54D|nr:signal peptidase II [Marinobacterium jannaschii]
MTASDHNQPRSGLVWLWLSGLMFVLDFITKQLADRLLSYGVPEYVLPVFDLTLLYNKGAAFSFLATAGGWQRWFFALIAVAVSIFLVQWLRRTPRSQWWLGLALSLVLGGALGNLYDRVVYGYVIDFLSFHYAGYYFPAFNLADTAITLGAMVLIGDMLLNSQDKDIAEKSDGNK